MRSVVEVARRSLTGLLQAVFPRGVALFIGAFTTANLAGSVAWPGYDATLWWVDLRALAPAVSAVLLVAVAALFLAWALWPQLAAWRRYTTCGICIVLAGVAGWNSLTYYRLLAAGVFATTLPVPTSLAVALLLAAMAFVATRPLGSTRRVRVPLVVLAAGGVAVAFALVQIATFGRTDYRRPADVAVVLGSRVYADGSLSLAVLDRVRTGCELYHAGLVRKLIVSGGPGDGAVHETEAMSRWAVEWGEVSADDVIRDPRGINTRATAIATQRIFTEHAFRRVLVVSHGYHLPRVKLAYRRVGVEVWTVPARQSRPLVRKTWFIAREVLALVRYWAWPA